MDFPLLVDLRLVVQENKPSFDELYHIWSETSCYPDWLLLVLYPILLTNFPIERVRQPTDWRHLLHVFFYKEKN